MLFLAVATLALWLIIFLLPWKPWLVREKWDVTNNSPRSNLNEITVLIPARNKELVIYRTLQSVLSQGQDLKVIVIDDQSKDSTEVVVKEFGKQVSLLSSPPLPSGWSGKLWALEQGRKEVDTSIILLLDADIELQPYVIQGLRQHMITEKKDLVSLLAKPPLGSFWEQLLMPAFIYFFKLLYPFSLANSNSKFVAAAAGGCIMIRSNVLEEIGGFTAIGTALIDDCKLANEVKKAGFGTWLGLTHSITSTRPYQGFGEIWDMVARTAYSQLNKSVLLLLFCTVIMVLAYVVPVFAIWQASELLTILGAATWLVMSLTYMPVLKYYQMSWLWAPLLPLIALMFLGMTWSSAIRYWRGERMRWRGRTVFASSKHQALNHN